MTIGTTSSGWMADGNRVPTAEDVAAHLAAVTATEPHTIPGSIFDEIFDLCARLGI